MSGLIGYNNLFTASGVTVTASGETTDYEKENAYDWKQYDWWKHTITGISWLRASFTAAQDADYMAIYGHNLHDVGGSVKPQYSTDGGSSWNDADTAVSPTDGNAIFFSFTSVSAADWRAYIVTTTGSAVIAGVMIGEALTLDRDVTAGFSPPTLSPDIESKTAVSEMGVNLGVSNIRTGVSGNIPLTNISASWVRSSLAPLIEHLNNGYPCVFAWDYTNYSDEVCLIWKTRSVAKPSHISKNLMSFDLSYEGIL